MNMAVISACLPLLRPLLFLFENHLRPNHSKSRTSSSYSKSWPSSHNKRPRIRQHDILSESEEAVMTTLAISTRNTHTLVGETTGTGPEEDVEMGDWRRKDSKGVIKAETEISTFWSNDAATLASFRSPSATQRAEDGAADDTVMGSRGV
ncbi:hypothetical protein K490DRAFT_54526 [Saccharata proteae CBS 121410]|uniref:Uncharacterized protein n=1 Tax=Saccharata proteae CBS 121410 TaxID=1314787 RepID=A0A9P4M1P1_9PEZI|nr:hypothetical protein K490DRAFT_54526 [Saccharata proteae CBS 121410]